MKKYAVSISMDKGDNNVLTITATVHAVSKEEAIGFSVLADIKYLPQIINIEAKEINE